MKMTGKYELTDYNIEMIIDTNVYHYNNGKQGNLYVNFVKDRFGFALKDLGVENLIVFRDEIIEYLNEYSFSGNDILTIDNFKDNVEIKEDTLYFNQKTDFDYNLTDSNENVLLVKSEAYIKINGFPILEKDLKNLFNKI